MNSMQFQRHLWDTSILVSISPEDTCGLHACSVADDDYKDKINNKTEIKKSKVQRKTLVQVQTFKIR